MIRVATFEDKDLLKPLFDALEEDNVYKKFFKGYKFSDEFFEYYTSKYAERMLIVVEADYHPIGIAFFDIVPLALDMPTRMARLTGFYIAPEYRKKGYMSEIREAFETWGKMVGADLLALGVTNKANPRKHGYKKYEVLYLKEIR